MLIVIDVRILYAFTYLFIVPPTMVINRKASKAIYRFYREGFGYGRLNSCVMSYKNHCFFSQVVIDKFAMYAGKKFDIKIIGFDNFKNLESQPGGFLQLSSHIGNYEVAGYSLISDKKRFNALVFGGEKESVMENRRKMFDHTNIRMIPMKPDMEYLFTLDNAINNGEIISMPADRVHGSQKAYSLNFLGRNACFPQGPFILSAMKEIPVLFVVVMKTKSTEYTIHVEQLDSPKDMTPRKRAEMLAEDYVSRLEKMVRKYPEQWYNYFDFWKI